MTMTTRLILISSIIFTVIVLAITPNLLAQGSSSATMQVQVSVVEGSSITQVNNHNSNIYDLATLSDVSELTTIAISNSNSKAYAIEQSKFLKLTDRSGQYLEIPIKYVDSIKGKDLVLKISTDVSESKDITKGKYKGSYTTSVAYL